METATLSEGEGSKNTDNEPKKYELNTKQDISHRADAWGIERLVLDTLSNHLPADCGGTELPIIKIKQDEQYYSLEDADRKKPSSEIIIEDSGKGFDIKKVDYRISDKSAETPSVGQMGEGLKMAAAVALRKNIVLQYGSRNWEATPFSRIENIDGKEYEILYFNVAENGKSIKGSKTIFRNVSQELLDEVLQIPKKVLPFNRTYTALFAEKTSEDEKRHASKIIDTNENKTLLFVKGIKVKELDSVFSYDLDIREISPNRNCVENKEELESKIRELLEKCSNSNVLRAILESAEKCGSSKVEFAVLQDVANPTNKPLWLDAFAELHPLRQIPLELASRHKKLEPKPAVLASNIDQFDKDAKYAGYEVVSLDKTVSEFLKKLGVMDTAELRKDQKYLWTHKNELAPDEKKIIDILSDKKNISEALALPLEHIEDYRVEVYSGIETKIGVINDPGAYFFREKKIALHRDLFKNPLELWDTFLHEFGHHHTGAGDYERTFLNFFTERLAVATINKAGIGNLCPAQEPESAQSEEESSQSREPEHIEGVLAEAYELNMLAQGFVGKGKDIAAKAKFSLAAELARHAMDLGRQEIAEIRQELEGKYRDALKHREEYLATEDKQEEACIFDALRGYNRNLRDKKEQIRRIDSCVSQTCDLLDSIKEVARMRLPNLVEKVHGRKNGNRLRHVVRVVAEAYKQNPEQLREFFGHMNDKLAGIATSAHHLLTGDIKPIQEIEYGGLGAIIEKSEEGLEFRKCQLHFAKLSRRALQKSKNKEQALQYSQNSDQALQHSTNTDKTLWYSENTDNALEKSQNADDALYKSRNTKKALWYSENKEDALRESENSGKSLYKSRNHDDTLYHSVNTGESLKESENSKCALAKSQNSKWALMKCINKDNGLKESKNSEHSLHGSINKNNALHGSHNSGFALGFSKNSDYALKSANNSELAGYYSKNNCYALENSKNSGGALEASENKDYVLCASINSGNALKNSSNSGEVLAYIKEHLQAVGAA